MYSSLTRACISVGLLQSGAHRWKKRLQCPSQNSYVDMLARVLDAAAIDVRGSSVCEQVGQCHCLYCDK